MKVIIPDALRSYTQQAAQVDAVGETLKEAFRCLDKQFPGMKFRVVNELDEIRPHIKVFVNRQLVNDLNMALSESDEIQIVQALSGGS